jgi:hypothetical protein
MRITYLVFVDGYDCLKWPPYERGRRITAIAALAPQRLFNHQFGGVAVDAAPHSRAQLRPAPTR